MDYKQRLHNVIDFIGKHLDDDLTLEQLSDVACFSKYHFHRLFTAYTGLSLQQYIRWLRLKRAAHQIMVDKERSIITIALNAGFESHESFTRAFKQIAGLSPSTFRRSPNWKMWEQAPYSLPTNGELKMNVTIKTLPKKRLATVEHRGDYQKLGNSLHKLITWAKAQPIPLKKPGEAFGLTYNDPYQVPAEDFRLDLALTIPENFKLQGDVVEKELPSGRYAVVVHKGSRKNIGDVIYGLYRDWLPTSGEEPGDLPCVFCYHNFDDEVAETELITEVWLLLK
ncbi:MAG: helix-turn-helix domain-containing protein [Alphaproteobacteria bacterium]|nr:helix-turn-helix domain-containing protein [Alphaproteobacteria bacterium]